MESTGEKNSSATEHQPMDAIESTENMSDRHDSLDCAASSLVKTAGMDQQYMATAIDGSENLSLQMEMEIDANELNAEPLEVKELELMDVNDDCLRAIFDHLSLLDLASVADVCKRLRSIAQEHFERTKPIVKIPQNVSCPKYQFRYNMNDVEKGEMIRRASRLLRNFGTLTVELEIEKLHDADIVGLITKYCGRNLTALKMRLEELRSLPIRLKPIFNNLKKLDFYSSCEIDVSIAKWLTAVEDLTLGTGASKLCDALLKQTYCNLQRIDFGSVTVDSRDFEMFLNKNPTLKDIRIGSLDVKDNHTFKLPAQIEKLELEITGCIETSSFGTLKNLTSLNLGNAEGTTNSTAAIIREIVAGEIPLKHLTLDNITLEVSNDFRNFCDDLSKLVRLETFKLEFFHCENVDEFKRLSSRLLRLSELSVEADCLPQETTLTVDELATIVSSFQNLQRMEVYSRGEGELDPVMFDSKSFEKFVSIVQSRKHNTRLDIKLVSLCYELEIPDELAQRHRHILSVEHN